MATTAPTIRFRPRIRLSEALERGLSLLIVIGLAVWVLVNFVANAQQSFSVLIIGVSLGSMYALIALGYTLVYGIIELINFAHGDLFMLGTVLTAFLINHWLGLTGPGPWAWLAVLLAFVVAMAFCGGLNVAAEVLAYRHLRRAPKLAPLITAVGISFAFQNIGLHWNGSQPAIWKSVLTTDGFTVGGVEVPYNLFIVVGITASLLAVMSWVVQRTRQGRAMRAVAQDQDGARLMGINVDSTISFTFLLGGVMAGAAAVLYLETQGVTRYDAGFRLGLYAFTAAVLGGIGNLVGAVVGGIIIGLIEQFNAGFPYGFGQKWNETVIFGILILVMVFKPEGLFGTRTTEKV